MGRPLCTPTDRLLQVVGVSDAARRHWFTTPSITTSPASEPSQGRGVEGPSSAKLSGPQPRRPWFRLVSVSHQLVSGRMRGCSRNRTSRDSDSSAREPGRATPRSPNTSCLQHIPGLESLRRPAAAASHSDRAQELTLVSPRPRSFPAPGESRWRAWRGARPRAPGPRSRCGQAPPPWRGRGYSPPRCSSATSPPAQTPLPPAPHPPRSDRPLGPGVAAVLATAAAAAAARVRSHAHRRGRARASARWRHVATDQWRASGNRRFRAGRSGPAGFAAFPHPPDPLPSWAGGPRVWLPCRHLAPGKLRHSTSLYGLTDRVTANGKLPAVIARAPVVEAAVA